MLELKTTKVDSEKYKNMLRVNTPYNVLHKIESDYKLMEKTNLALVFAFEDGNKYIVSSTSFAGSGCEDMCLADDLENKEFELFLVEIDGNKEV